ncbi:Thioredoxin-like fold [Lasallia pustulata]|uniref:Thioredoxin-like fold n=1 Tax=Lasallia pustulata TaxID=136370 RepID=A0A1W5DC03_9LECA|nr:Thioredoxin-like fold [Lasallia pustulata]
MSSSPSAAPLYELLYHPTIPGRGEYIRLALEITHTPYTDVANATPSGPTTVQSTISIPTHDASGNPPVFAPPALRVPNGGRNGAPLLLSQTANILLYLGPRLGLVPADDEVGRLWVNQMTLTALDWSDEAHEVHHPVGSSLWYEEQVEEAKRRSEEATFSTKSKSRSTYARPQLQYPQVRSTQMGPE